MAGRISKGNGHALTMEREGMQMEKHEASLQDKAAWGAATHRLGLILPVEASNAERRGSQRLKQTWMKFTVASCRLFGRLSFPRASAEL